MSYIFLLSKYISKYLFSDIFKLKKYYFAHDSQLKIIYFQNTVSKKVAQTSVFYFYFYLLGYLNCKTLKVIVENPKSDN